MDLLEAPTIVPPPWFDEVKKRPGARFVELPAGPVTLDGSEVFVSRSFRPSQIEDHVCVYEQALAKCGCGAKRSAHAALGRESMVESHPWIGWLCVSHAQKEMKSADVVFGFDVMETDGDSSQRFMAGTARELLAQFSEDELEQELRKRHEQGKRAIKSR